VHRLDDAFDHAGIGQGRRVSQLILLSAQDLAQDSSHDFATSGLGQVVDDKDKLGSREGSDGLADLANEFLPQLRRVLELVLDGYEGLDGLTRQVVGNTNHGGLRNCGMVDQSGFDLGGGEAVTADIDDIVDTSTDPVVTLMITSSSVTRELWSSQLLNSLTAYYPSIRT
jgi:hypothetical protein